MYYNLSSILIFNIYYLHINNTTFLDPKFIQNRRRYERHVNRWHDLETYREPKTVFLTLQQITHDSLWRKIDIESHKFQSNELELKMLLSFFKKTKSLLRSNSNSELENEGPISQAFEAISLDQTFNLEDPEDLRQIIYGK